MIQNQFRYKPGAMDGEPNPVIMQRFYDMKYKWILSLHYPGERVSVIDDLIWATYGKQIIRGFK